MKVSMKVEGMDALIKSIGRFELELRGAVLELIQTYLFKIEASAKKNLAEAGGDASKPGTDLGRLMQSLRTVLHKMALAGEVYTEVDYAIYVHEGTRGPRKPPPIDVLKRWAVRHGMDEDAAYAIQKVIARRGTRANPFLLDAFNEHINDFMRDLKALVRDFTRRYDGGRGPRPGGSA